MHALQHLQTMWFSPCQKFLPLLCILYPSVYVDAGFCSANSLNRNTNTHRLVVFIFALEISMRKKTDSLIFPILWVPEITSGNGRPLLLFISMWMMQKKKVKHPTENIPKLERDMCVKLISDKMLDWQQYLVCLCVVCVKWINSGISFWNYPNNSTNDSIRMNLHSANRANRKWSDYLWCLAANF